MHLQNKDKWCLRELKKVFCLMSLDVCMCARVCVCVHGCVHVCVCLRVCGCVCVCECVSMYFCVLARVCVCVCVWCRLNWAMSEVSDLWVLSSFSLKFMSEKRQVAGPLWSLFEGALKQNSSPYHKCISAHWEQTSAYKSYSDITNIETIHQ